MAVLMTSTRIGDWHIYYDPPPIPARSCDWHYYHDDFDGAPDANDNRCGHAGSFDECLTEIEEMHGDNVRAALAQEGRDNG